MINVTGWILQPMQAPSSVRCVLSQVDTFDSTTLQDSEVSMFYTFFREHA